MRNLDSTINFVLEGYIKIVIWKISFFGKNMILFTIIPPCVLEIGKMKVDYLGCTHSFVFTHLDLSAPCHVQICI